MRKSKNRISVWLIISITLLVGWGYLYFTRSGSPLENFNQTTNNKPRYLIYLSDNSGKKIIKRDLDSGEETILLKDFGELMSLNSDIDREVAVILVKQDNKFLVKSLSLVNGSLSFLGEVNDYTPSALYEFYADHYVVISGDKSNTLNYFDDSDKKITTNGTITAVYPVDNRQLQLAIFDGNSTEIKNYLGTTETKIVAKIDGRVYSFNENKVLYTKKITSETDSTSPIPKIIWKIALKDLKTGSETLLSEGNFDQNAVASAGYDYIAYQKKYDGSDQPDGRIFLINPDNKSDRLGNGIPLIFAY